MSDKRARILDAARTLLTRGGLDAWSTERVARAAGCAKGLVHYHFKGRTALLAEVARSLVHDAADQRTGVLTGTGTTALDRLWKELEREESSGELAARLSLLGASDKVVRSALEPGADQLAVFAAAIASALTLPVVTSAEARATWAMLDGLGAAMLIGSSRGALHEGFDRWWLTLLPA
ncbi:MAG TPA: helix-turn-helix domain-containing protein [Gemmatimonadales bacterium]|nr:helix-turn-helix domain-containing protein [Gemmatimonadales bacterium]